MGYLLSADIKVYPTARRDDSLDRNARLNTEQNLTSIINRLTNIEAFVIKGLEVTDNILRTGSCNIHGYVFNITKTQDLSDYKAERNKVLAFQIKTKLLNDVEELINFDTDASDLDSSSNANTSRFKGLQLVAVNNTDPLVSTNTITNTTTYTLPLAKAIQSGSNWIWKEVINSFGQGVDDNIRPNMLTIDSSNIRISNPDNSFNTYATVDQDIASYLRFNLDIDDGEID